MNEERLKELEAFKAKLEIQLNETVFLIQGYKNAMENQQDDVPEQVERSLTQTKRKSQTPRTEEWLCLNDRALKNN
jgi:hypothetical protein